MYNIQLYILAIPHRLRTIYRERDLGKSSPCNRTCTWVKRHMKMQLATQRQYAIGNIHTYINIDFSNYVNIHIHIDINMIIDITPPHAPPDPSADGPGMGWGGVISIFILTSILTLIFMSLLIDIAEANQYT